MRDDAFRFKRSYKLEEVPWRHSIRCRSRNPGVGAPVRGDECFVRAAEGMFRGSNPAPVGLGPRIIDRCRLRPAER